METIHEPVVAGLFYPERPDVLRNTVRDMLAGAATLDVSGRVAGVIVPHAALQYSGPIAATAYRILGNFERVIAIGPSHFSLFDGLATLPADGWRTPLGVVEVSSAPNSGWVQDRIEPYLREHCLEVQLPFLQQLKEHPVVTPLLTGRIEPDEVADVLEGLVTGDSLLLVSSDLSHYLTHDAATHVDTATAASIVARDPGALGRDSACGRLGIQAALLLAHRRNWTVEQLDLRTSADTAGSPDRVVGYGAFVFTED